jgi:hypothetical protein
MRWKEDKGRRRRDAKRRKTADEVKRSQTDIGSEIEVDLKRRRRLR